MRIYNNPNETLRKTLTQRPALEVKALNEIIKDVFDQVESKADLALFEMTEKYDKVVLKNLDVSPDILKKCYDALDPELLTALEQAARNIKMFHEAQQSEEINITIAEGIELGQKSVPIKRVGIYIPGGTAPLLSTTLMLAIPAKIAGCAEIVLCSPPSSNGQIDPAILGAAYFLGIDEVYQIGGAQAIAALCIGTETIKPVSKVFGPGNQYVTAAKELAIKYGVAIDLPAGPSELLVFVDSDSVPEFVASDVLSQAEHGIDSQVVVVSVDENMSMLIQKEIEKQLVDLPRKDLASKSIENSFITQFDNISDAFAFINAYAPEHLIISGNNADNYLDLIDNAGSVFLGNYCPESAGDYASGTNHTLPTNGWAKSYNGVTLDSFLRKMSFQKISKTGLKNIANSVVKLARTEQLEGHARAIEIRLHNQLTHAENEK